MSKEELEILEKAVQYDKKHRIVTEFDKKPLLRDCIEHLLQAYKDSTPNSKIREKIEERKLYLSGNDIAYSDDYVLEVLEELLEEK